METFSSTHERRSRMSWNLKMKEKQLQQNKHRFPFPFHTLFSCQVQESDNKSLEIVLKNHCRGAWEKQAGEEKAEQSLATRVIVKISEICLTFINRKTLPFRHSSAVANIKFGFSSQFFHRAVIIDRAEIYGRHSSLPPANWNLMTPIVHWKISFTFFPTVFQHIFLFFWCFYGQQIYNFFPLRLMQTLMMFKEEISFTGKRKYLIFESARTTVFKGYRSNEAYLVREGSEHPDTLFAVKDIENCKLPPFFFFYRFSNKLWEWVFTFELTFFQFDFRWFQIKKKKES